MGDSATNGTLHSPKRPGIMIVRPSLHSQSKQNAATFKRWTVMHFRDLLNVSASTPDAHGISKTMRYTNTAGELFYTIHADDVGIWKTKEYYDVSRRLDLENVRNVKKGEEAVLPGEHDLGLPEGEEPMVWHLVNAEFGIFVDHGTVEPEQAKQQRVQSYHNVPIDLLSPEGGEPTAPLCLLVTLTYTGAEDEVDNTSPPDRLLNLEAEAVDKLQFEYADDGARVVFTSIYRHVEDAQPDMHPVIAEGAHGKGNWVACILAQGEVSEELHVNLQVELGDSVDEIMRREGKSKDNLSKWDVKVGVWRGELFMC